MIDIIFFIFKIIGALLIVSFILQIITFFIETIGDPSTWQTKEQKELINKQSKEKKTSITDYLGY